MHVGWLAKSTNVRVASVRFRCLTPIRVLQADGVNAALYDPDQVYQLVVFSKRYDEADQETARRMRGQGVRTVLDLSDNHFYNPFELSSYEQVARNLRAMCEEVDAVVCCSRALADIVSTHANLRRAPYVVGDAVEALPVPAKPATNFAPPADGPFSILWFGSHGSPNAPSGMSDVLRIRDQLAWANSMRRCELVVVSNSVEKFDALKHQLAMPARYCEHTAAVLGAELVQANLVVIPITPNPFTRCKSANRIASALWHGAPVAADAIPSYEPLRGFVSMDDWDRGFRSALEADPAVKTRTRAGQAFVRQHYNDHTLGAAWRATLNEIATLDDIDTPGRRAPLAARSPSAPASSGPVSGPVDAPVSDVQPRAAHVGAQTVDQGVPASPAYLTRTQELTALARLPLASLMRGVALDRVVARLRQERALTGETPDQTSALMIVVLVDRAPGGDLAQTLASIALQSHPGVTCRLVQGLASGAGCDQRALEAFLAGLDVAPAQATIWQSWSEAVAEPDAQRLVVLQAGEILDPSACASIARRDHDACDVILMDVLQIDSAGQALSVVQNSATSRTTVLHAPLVGSAAAFRPNLARHIVLEPDCSIDARLHVAHIAWALDAQCAWASASEILLTRPADDPAGPLSLASTLFDQDPSRYAARLEQGPLALTRQSGPAPYALSPRQVATSIAVIIPFRDQPELTIRALSSVAEQRTRAQIELLLVDNQSTALARRAVDAAVDALPASIQTRILDFDQAFNHSEQCNRAARVTHADVLVMLNNDAALLSPDGLDSLACWALYPGIASAGPALVNPQTGDVSAGMTARLAAQPWESVAEERPNSALGPFVHETFGASFACAAIARETYWRLGGLDADRFPNGFNDIAFACAAHAAGLTSVCLGHIRVAHAPGQSRGKLDETGEKARLLARNPQIASTLRRAPVVRAPEELGLGPVRSRSSSARRLAREPLLAVRSAMARSRAALLDAGLVRRIAALPGVCTLLQWRPARNAARSAYHALRRVMRA